jgi:hypothetical protein
MLSQCLIHQAGTATPSGAIAAGKKWSQCLIHQAGTATPFMFYFPLKSNI